MRSIPVLLLIDQIIPFTALAKGASEFTVEELTDHVQTNIIVTEKMTGVKFKVDRNENRISVEGIGFKSESWTDR